MPPKQLFMILLLVLAFACFIIDALGLRGNSATRISLTPFGLACWVIWAILRTL